MRYIILDLFGGPEYASIVTNTDGNNLVFHERTETEAKAIDCQGPSCNSLKRTKTPLSIAIGRRFLARFKCGISAI